MSHGALPEVRVMKLELVGYAVMLLFAWRFPELYKTLLLNVYSVILVLLGFVLVVVVQIRLDQRRAKRRRERSTSVVVPFRR